MPDFGFQPRDFRVGVEQSALGGMHAITRGEVRLARFLEPGLGFAQRRVLGFEVDHRAFDLARQAFAFGLRVVPAQEPEQLLLARQFIVVFSILPSNRRLPFEALHLRSEFGANVLDARQVVARIGNPVLGFLAALLVFGNAGCFLEEDAQLVGLGLDDARDRPLPDDRVGAWSEPRAEKQVSDVLAANMQVVDVVLGLAAARQYALDR